MRKSLARARRRETIGVPGLTMARWVVSARRPGAPSSLQTRGPRVRSIPFLHGPESSDPAPLPRTLAFFSGTLARLSRLGIVTRQRPNSGGERHSLITVKNSLIAQFNSLAQGCAAFGALPARSGFQSAVRDRTGYHAHRSHRDEPLDLGHARARSEGGGTGRLGRDYDRGGIAGLTASQHSLLTVGRRSGN